MDSNTRVKVHMRECKEVYETEKKAHNGNVTIQ